MSRAQLTTLVAFIAVSLSGVWAARAEGDQDEMAVRKAGEAYLEAFHKQDAAALANFWSPEAVCTSRTSGEQVVGRKAIESEFKALFEQFKDIKLELTIHSIQFVSPNVAVEHGNSRFLTADQEPVLNEYSAVYVQRDGKWLLDRVTEEEIPTIQSHYEQLKELEWLVGSWIDEEEDARVVTECNWTKNKNFMTRSFTVSIRDRIEMSGMQIIGWDPAQKQIRSWTFDSDGGFASGQWIRKGDRWHIRKMGVLADGGKSTAIKVLTYIDDNTCTVQSTQRAIDGQILPNIDEVRVVRVTASN